MLLVVCPNLAVDRVLQVDRFEVGKVQRSRAALIQPGGKGSNVARVFRQLGGEVVLVGFVGRHNGSWIVESLREMGIHVDAVPAYDGYSRTCSIICDPRSATHPTVVNEESSEIEPRSAEKLLSVIERWIPQVDAVLTTGSLSLGLPTCFYAEVLDRARCLRKLTAIDATGAALKVGLLARPAFMKPNAEEFAQLTAGSSISLLAAHTALTFGTAGAALIHDGKCLFAIPPRIYGTNPIGSGDAFAAGYLKGLLSGADAEQSLRWAIAAAACDAATMRPGFVALRDVEALLPEVVSRFQ